MLGKVDLFLGPVVPIVEETEIDGSLLHYKAYT